MKISTFSTFKKEQFLRKLYGEIRYLIFFSGDFESDMSNAQLKLDKFDEFNKTIESNIADIKDLNDTLVDTILNVNNLDHETSKFFF